LHFSNKGSRSPVGSYILNISFKRSVLKSSVNEEKFSTPQLTKILIIFSAISVFPSLSANKSCFGSLSSARNFKFGEASRHSNNSLSLTF
jgi:hypothetical protein